MKAINQPSSFIHLPAEGSREHHDILAKLPVIEIDKSARNPNYVSPGEMEELIEHFRRVSDFTLENGEPLKF